MNTPFALMPKPKCYSSFSAVTLFEKYGVDCKTVVGFFLKISKEIGKAWRKSITCAKRASLTRPTGVWGERKKPPSLTLCFQPHSRPFVWMLARTWIRKKKGLFCSLAFPGSNATNLYVYFVELFSESRYSWFPRRSAKPHDSQVYKTKIHDSYMFCKYDSWFHFHPRVRSGLSTVY